MIHAKLNLSVCVFFAAVVSEVEVEPLNGNVPLKNNAVSDAVCD